MELHLGTVLDLDRFGSFISHYNHCAGAGYGARPVLNPEAAHIAIRQQLSGSRMITRHRSRPLDGNKHGRIQFVRDGYPLDQ